MDDGDSQFRLALLQVISKLPNSQFWQLVFAFKTPSENISSVVEQGTQAYQFLNWIESELNTHTLLKVRDVLKEYFDFEISYSEPDLFNNWLREQNPQRSMTRRQQEGIENHPDAESQEQKHSSVREYAILDNNSKYTFLESFLKARDWRAADIETEKCVLKAFGHEEGERIFESELKNFPCSDLLKIDQLWMNHSQGKFGFSIQLQIYRDSGAAPNQYPNEIFWNMFSQKMGWMRNSTLQVAQYQNIYLDSRTPNGYLPYFDIIKSSGTWSCALYYVLKRLQECNSSILG